MIIARDIVLGFVCWITTFALMIGNFTFWMYLSGLSSKSLNQDRTFAFVAGGAGLLIISILLAGIAALVIGGRQS